MTFSKFGELAEIVTYRAVKSKIMGSLPNRYNILLLDLFGFLVILQNVSLFRENSYRSRNGKRQDRGGAVL